MNYYEIKCKLGHSGTGQFRIITFYIKAKDVVTAIDKAKSMPGVKHHSTSAIVGLKSISEVEYIENRKQSAYESFKKV